MHVHTYKWSLVGLELTSKSSLKFVRVCVHTVAQKIKSLVGNLSLQVTACKNELVFWVDLHISPLYFFKAPHVFNSLVSPGRAHVPDSNRF